MGRDDLDTDDPILRRRRALRNSNAAALWVGLAAGGLLLIGAGGVTAYLLMPRPAGVRGAGGLPRLVAAGPSAASEGTSWNHAELLAHLRGRGLSLGMREKERPPIAASSPPAAYLYRTSAKFVAEEGASATSVEVNYDYNSPDVILVERHPTPQDARIIVGPAGDRAWSWGCFAFRTNEGSGPLLDEVRNALGG